VGVTRFQSGDHATSIPTFNIDLESESRQKGRVASVRASRGETAWREAIGRVREAARADTNLVGPIVAAVEAGATIGEISDTLRAVFGEHRETSTL
jgi:methylmalonyl-CoA mutase N-terminal domain/subunit